MVLVVKHLIPFGWPDSGENSEPGPTFAVDVRAESGHQKGFNPANTLFTALEHIITQCWTGVHIPGIGHSQLPCFDRLLLSAKHLYCHIQDTSPSVWRCAPNCSQKCLEWHTMAYDYYLLTFATLLSFRVLSMWAMCQKPQKTHL